MKVAMTLIGWYGISTIWPRRLQLLAEAQRLLLRDVSHELRSPLARMNVGVALASGSVGRNARTS